MDVEALRKRYLPNKIKVLFIAEARPDARDRFFYYETVHDKDFLYLYLMRALYDDAKFIDIKSLRGRKAEFLNRFKNDGCYLMDAVDNPIKKGESKSKAILANAKKKIAEVDDVLSKYGDEKTKIVLIAATVFKELYDLMKDEFNIVNDSPVYFPSFSRQSDFLRQMSEIMEEIRK